jgi:hypothetical protein
MLLLLLLVVVGVLHVGFFAVVGVGWRLAIASFTSEHRDFTWRAVGDVDVGVVVAIFASSRPALAHDACGQRITHGFALWLCCSYMCCCCCWMASRCYCCYSCWWASNIAIKTTNSNIARSGEALKSIRLQGLEDLLLVQLFLLVL